MTLFNIRLSKFFLRRVRLTGDFIQHWVKRNLLRKVRVTGDFSQHRVKRILFKEG